MNNVDPESPEKDASSTAGPFANDLPVPRLPRHIRREVALRDALRALLRDCYEGQYGVRLPDGGEIDLDFRVKASPTDGWAVRFEPPLDQQVDAQLADVQATRAAFRQGIVYCFRCSSTACGHGTPPSPLHVFRGYSPTGVPEWFEMAQALIDAEDSRAAELFADPPRALSCIRMGRLLKSQQLGSFGRSSRTYSILGQVMTGYLRMPSRFARRGVPRLALTLQVVETRAEKAEVKLALNRIVGGLQPEDLVELLSSDWQPGVGRALDRAVVRLESLEQRVRAARGSAGGDVSRLLREVPVLLRRLARDLEAGCRQGERRTRHVEDRRRQQRPIHKALEDAAAATPDALFFDEKKSTTIALGKQNRAHVFNEEGRHVTSFVLAADGAEFRVRTRRWRRLDTDEVARFRGRVASVMRRGGDG